MEEAVGGSKKVTSIREIVRLKGLLKKWEKVTIGAKAKNNKKQQSASSSTGKQIGGIPPGVMERLKGSEIRCDSDDESECRSPEPPHDVPKGYLAVYVGPELRRFIIPTSYLSDPLFKVLLEKVEEEFGFDQSGALTIPCEIETFKYLLQCMENHQRENSPDIIQVPENNHMMS